MCIFDEHWCPDCHETFGAEVKEPCAHPGDHEKGCAYHARTTWHEQCKRCFDKEHGAYYRGEAYGPGQTEETKAKVAEFLANRTQEDKDKEAAEKEAAKQAAIQQARIARGLPPIKPDPAEKK